MATSGATTGILTAREMISAALQDLGVLAAGREASGADVSLGLRHLNYLLKEWQADGVNLWRQEDVSIVWPAATAEGAVTGADGRGVNDIISLRYVPTGGAERQLERWELDDYSSLPNKSTAGAPTIYSVMPNATGIRVRLWPVPDAATTLLAVVNRTIEDVSDEAQTVDIPVQWTSTVIANLAARMSNAYGQAEANVAIIREAARLYQLMRSADRPVSYFMSSVGAYYQ